MASGYGDKDRKALVKPLRGVRTQRERRRGNFDRGVYPGFLRANSPWAQGSFTLRETYFGFDLGGWDLEKPLLLWVNDGLMALFFFLVGLEVKREVLVGELSSPRDAMLAVVAASGGMAAPAVIYVAPNWGEGIDGWGVPVATDIAFALGIMAYTFLRVPSSESSFQRLCLGRSLKSKVVTRQPSGALGRSCSKLQ